MQISLSLFVLVALASSATLALNNGLGRLPQMGYNTWYDLECSESMNETVIKATADAMVSTGLRDLGYIYVNLDDCFIQSRDEQGNLVVDPKKFPSGMKALADYMHERGLKFGVYTDRGAETCAGRPAALSHEGQDARTYAAWGVDYVKEDSCHASDDHGTAFAEYGKMRDGLNATGRPMFFSLCGWNWWYAPVGGSLGNSWRIGPDTNDWAAIKTNIDIDSTLAAFAGPSKGWNDPCLLINEDHAGKQLATPAQARAQFSMWSVLAAPMLLSMNVRALSPFAYETYTNAEVIAVGQDTLGQQGWRVMGGNLTGVQGGALTMSECASLDHRTLWQQNQVMSGTLSNSATGMCLNVDDCGLDVIQYPCVAQPGSCCSTQGGACPNQQWRVSPSNHSIISYLPRDKCLSLSSSLSVAPCNSSLSTQQWSYTSDSQLLHIPSRQCLSASLPLNVSSRPLSDHSVAMVFLNADHSTTHNVTCNSTCFANAKVSATKLRVRDLWKHEEVGIVETAKGFTAMDLAPDGGSAMFRFFPLN